MVWWLRLSIRCKGLWFDPWSGNQDLTCYVVQEKKKKQSQNTAPHQSCATRVKLQPVAAIRWGAQEEAFCVLDVHSR